MLIYWRPLKSNAKIINVLGSIYATENGYQNCLLLNDKKMVVEALQGNLFLVKGTSIITPPTSDGCLRGIIRKQLIEICKTLPGIYVRRKIDLFIRSPKSGRIIYH